MKTKYILTTLILIALHISSCEKGFVEKNINPVLATTIDPVYQLATSQIVGLGSWHYDGNIVQQVTHLLGGAEEAGNRNTYADNHSSSHFNTLYGNQIKNLVDMTNTLNSNPLKSNLYNMARIMKAYCFQLLVDRHGDIPYSEAGLGNISSNNFPKYDDQEIVYEDIVNELKEAVDALDASKDKVNEMYFNGDIPKWKKFGNSLLLRVAMRYTKIDEVKAKTLVEIATNPSRGGVMTSNNDNVVIKYSNTQTNSTNGFVYGSTRYIWHLGKPFVDFLQDNNDPRLLHIAALYPNSPSATNPGPPNTNPADQIGCPFGYTDVNIVNAPDYPGKIGSTFKYSQVNRSTMGRVDSWAYIITYAQTQFLLAEARFRGYITTGEVKGYYEAGVRGHMTQLDFWGTLPGAASPISQTAINAYLLEPRIAFDPSLALQQINEQYWVACFMIWPEAWANFRRSGYPQLNPINFPGEDPYVAIATGGDGFIHRLQYSQKEWSVNTDKVQEAKDRMGGDNMGVRIFWDSK